MSTKQAIVWAVAIVVGTPFVYAAIRIVEIATLWLASAVGVWPA